jgi:hypothetical protein
MRSVTLDFSLMVSPNGTSRVLPSEVLVNRKETEHVHGASEWVSRHSVGHLKPFGKVRVFIFPNDSPSASAAGARESDSRNRLYEGGLPCTLPADDCDSRNIQIYVGSTTWINEWWRVSLAEVHTQWHARE